MATSSVDSSQLAVQGGPPAVSLPCPGWPVTGEKEQVWMAEVVRSGKWSWMGEHEVAFSREFADFMGTKHCLCLANGTVTLQCALQAVGVMPGDEVIVPALTWISTAQAPMDIGADTVLVDVDPETWCLDAAAFEAAITPRTKAVIPVHLYGCMCDMDAIMDVARRHHVKVIEDNAHQHGSRWRDQMAGGIGDVGSFSFQQSKVLTAGEGGAVTCNDDDIYEIIHCLKQAGRNTEMGPGNRYSHNFRLTEMQCVLLRGGLSRLPEQTRIRDENAQWFAAELARIGGPLRAAKRDPHVTQQAYYAMTLHFDPAKADGATRGQYAAALDAEGLGVGAPYEPVYRSPLLNLYDRLTSPIPFRDPKTVQNYAGLKLPATERICESTGLVLSHAQLLGSRDYMRQMVEAVEKVNANLAAVRELAQ